MTIARPGRWAVVLAALAAAGCVNRRFVIESNVPNAQVYIDNRPVGPAPAHSPFEYYGYYTVTLVQPGYEISVNRVHVRAPWYAYPPFDFFAEVLWPFRVEDVRRYYFELTPARQTRTDELINAADALRERGLNLPPPSEPQPARPGGPAAGPPVGGPAPIAPGLPGPVPVRPSPRPPENPLIPSVQPSGYTPAPGGTYLK
jgi:hypothetical protein